MTAVVIGFVLGAHLICMNLACGGPLVCMWLEWRERRETRGAADGASPAGALGRRLAVLSIAALLAGSLLGLLLGALLWSDAYRHAVERLSYKIKWGGVEYIFSLVLLVAHAAWWRAAPRSGAAARAARIFLLLLAGTNLAYHFPFLFAVLSQAVAEGVDGEGAITAAVFRSRMAEPLILALSAHFLIASFAVCGAAMTLLSPDAPGLRKTGGRLALLATLAQIPVGFWLVVVLPPASQRALMGGDSLATLAFALSLLGALALLHHLAAVALRDDSGPSAKISVALMIAVIALMSLALRQIKAPAADTPPRGVVESALLFEVNPADGKAVPRME